MRLSWVSSVPMQKEMVMRSGSASLEMVRYQESEFFVVGSVSLPFFVFAGS